MRRLRIAVAVVCLGLITLTECANAQRQAVTVTTPLATQQSTFFEQQGVAWSLNGPNWFARFGNPAATAGPHFGIGGFNDGVSGRLRFSMGQGSRRMQTVTAPSLTVTPGFPGTLQSGQVTPFVTGWQPVVGSGGVRLPTSVPAQAALIQNGRVTRQILAARQQRQSQLLQQALHRAQQAEQAGELRTARANYRIAYPLASPPLRRWIHVQITNLVHRNENR